MNGGGFGGRNGRVLRNNDSKSYFAKVSFSQPRPNSAVVVGSKSPQSRMKEKFGALDQRFFLVQFDWNGQPSTVMG